MGSEPFIGSEAIRQGLITSHALRTRCHPIYPDVYMDRSSELTPTSQGYAAWLWTRRRGVVAGLSASAMHGARWVSLGRGATVIHANRRPPAGLHVWSDRIASDERCVHRGIAVTTPARTALDIARRHRTGEAVAALDALCRATDLKSSELLALAERHKGDRGMKRARRALDLVDPGAQSPKETWLRLLLLRAGFPPVTTQVMVHDGRYVPLAYIDMGWEDVMVGVEYDGDQHRSDRRQYVKDIKRMELLESLGWLIVRVVAEDHPDDIIRRVWEARLRRR